MTPGTGSTIRPHTLGLMARLWRGRPGRGAGRLPVPVLLAGGTIVSRLLGFLRVAVLAYAIGTVSSPGADAYQTAGILPNTIYALVAGGLLTAVLVPHLVRATTAPD